MNFAYCVAFLTFLTLFESDSASNSNMPMFISTRFEAHSTSVLTNRMNFKSRTFCIKQSHCRPGRRCICSDLHRKICICVRISKPTTTLTTTTTEPTTPQNTKVESTTLLTTTKPLIGPLYVTK